MNSSSENRRVRENRNNDRHLDSDNIQDNKPSTSSADNAVFKRPRTPPPKRRRFDETPGSSPKRPANRPNGVANAQDADANNGSREISLIADIEQANAVAAWKHSRQSNYQTLLERVKRTMRDLTDQDRINGEKIMDLIAHQILEKRSFDRAYVYLNVDALIADVEMQNNPHLRNLPVGICFRNAIHAINELASEQGVQPEMPVPLAVMLCPALRVIPAHFDKYNEITMTIKEIVRSYDPTAIVTINYIILNLTRLLVEGETLDSLAHKPNEECLVDEIKRTIFEKTGIRACAGVAPTPFIARLASVLRRPSGTYVVSAKKQCIDSFIRDLPVNQFCGISGPTEMLLHEANMETSDRIWQRRGFLPYLVDDRTMKILMCICLGCNPEFVGLEIGSRDETTVSHSKWVFGTRRIDFLANACEEICLNLEKKMKKKKLVGQNLTVKICNVKRSYYKKSMALSEPTNKAHRMLPTSLVILDKFLSQDHSLLINGIRITMSGLSPPPQTHPLDLSGGSRADPDPNPDPNPDPLGQNDTNVYEVSTFSSVPPGDTLQGTSNMSQNTPLESEGDSSMNDLQNDDEPSSTTVENQDEDNTLSSDLTTGLNSSNVKIKGGLSRAEEKKTYTVYTCPDCEWWIRTPRIDRSESMMRCHVNYCLTKKFPELFD